jgi:hypothetical protein
MYTVLLPPGGNPIAVNKYIMSYLLSRLRMSCAVPVFPPCALLALTENFTLFFIVNVVSSGVTEIFHLHNPSSRTVALGWTEPLTKKSKKLKVN